jgi:integrase
MSVTGIGGARRGRRAEPASPPIGTFITSWQLALEAAGKSPRTVRSYLDSVRALARFLDAQGMPCGVEEVGPGDLRAFLLAEERRTSAVSAAVHYRNLCVYFGWLVREEERPAPSPMERVDKPKVTKKAKSFFNDDELARLLKTCAGTSFEDRRDTARAGRAPCAPPAAGRRPDQLQPRSERESPGGPRRYAPCRRRGCAGCRQPCGREECAPLGSPSSGWVRRLRSC